MRIPAGTLITTRALLFDMDGTLIDSTLAVERIWGGWARQRGLDFEDFRRRMHGRRSIDLMSELVGEGGDPHEEVRQIDEAELVQTEGIVAIAGAAEFLAALPARSWGLVTSASRELASARMKAAGLALPDVMVTATDVLEGKPHPAGYLRALQGCGCASAEAVVFEDAPAGVAAGRAAGCQVITIATHMSAGRLSAEDWIPDFRAVALEQIDADGRLQLRIL